MTRRSAALRRGTKHTVLVAIGLCQSPAPKVAPDGRPLVTGQDVREAFG